jgi:hypothetical protein
MGWDRELSPIQPRVFSAAGGQTTFLRFVNTRATRMRNCLGMPAQDLRRRTIRLLKARMTVIPIRACLDDGKLVGERFALFYFVVAYGRHTVHLVRQNEAVPMYGCRIVEVIGDLDGDIFTLFKPKDRARRPAVVPDSCSPKLTGIDHDRIYCQFVCPGRHNR